MKDIKNVLNDNNYKTLPGMTKDEIEEAEKIYKIKFPLEYKNFLKEFVFEECNWSDFSSKNIEHIKELINWPIEGIIFDIKNNGFWMEKLGAKSRNIEERINVFLNKINEFPKLIPIINHDYIVCANDVQNPIISVYQSDFIISGDNLVDYLHQLISNDNKSKSNMINIPFWSDIIDCNYTSTFMVTEISAKYIFDILKKALLNKKIKIDELNLIDFYNYFEKKIF